LMICRTIIESHGGSLKLLTRRPEAAVFRFVLPVARGGQR